jgi:hypothetical protein
VASTEDTVLGFANTHGHLGRLPEYFADSTGLRNWLSQLPGVDAEHLVVTAADRPCSALPSVIRCRPTSLAKAPD